MVGKNVNVELLSREEAVDYVKNRCKNCSIANDCNGADANVCNQNVEFLVKKWRRK